MTENTQPASADAAADVRDADARGTDARGTDARDAELTRVAHATADAPGAHIDDTEGDIPEPNEPA
jgi:hypothetical protein